MQTVEELAGRVGVAQACEALSVSRTSYYRFRRPMPKAAAIPRPTPARALSEAERVRVRDVLNSEPYADASPREVYAALLEKGVYLGHWRTMYRVLSVEGEVRERRNQLSHPAYVRPELLATGPNELWSWDITKLRGPARGVWLFLYVMLDVFSRYVVGWLVAERESEVLAKELIDAACAKQGIQPGQLTVHADRGAPMVAKSVAVLMSDLGVRPSHSRPHVSDDNPFSESQFKTLKYHSSFPDRFGGLEDTRLFCGSFFLWYNEEHYHSGLALLTPSTVHYHRTDAVLADRQRTMNTAYAAHPERFVNGPPNVLWPPTEVWINPPKLSPGTSPAAISATLLGAEAVSRADPALFAGSGEAHP